MGEVAGIDAELDDFSADGSGVGGAVLAAFDNDGEGDGAVVFVSGETSEPGVVGIFGRAGFPVDCDTLLVKAAVRKHSVCGSSYFTDDGSGAIVDDVKGLR